MGLFGARDAERVDNPFDVSSDSPRLFVRLITIAAFTASLALLVGALAGEGGFWLAEGLAFAAVGAAALLSLRMDSVNVFLPLAASVVAAFLFALVSQPSVAIAAAVALVGLTPLGVGLMGVGQWRILWSAVIGVVTTAMMRPLTGESTVVRAFVELIVLATGGIVLLAAEKLKTGLLEPADALRTLIDNAGDAVIVIDDNHVVRAFAGNAEPLFGYATKEVIGRPIDMLLPLEGRAGHGNNLRQFAAGPDKSRDMSNRAQVAALHKSGQSIPVEITISKIPLGNSMYFGAIVRDISAREAAIERGRMLSDSRLELIAAVSHEIRTPLTAVLGFAEILRTGDSRGAELQTTVDTIVREAQEISFIVEDLLVAARFEVDDIPIVEVATDLGAQARQVAETFSGDLDIPVVVLGEAEPIATADPVRTRQVVRNLVSNALKYGLPPIRIEVEKAADSGWARVVDMGSGPSPEAAASIFDAFTSGNVPAGKPGSFGLGLSISRRLARAMGGDLTYARTDGETVFSLRLPIRN